MNSRRAKQNRGGVRKQLVIEISSGEDSDVEFMGYGSPSHGKEFDEAHDNKPGDAATKENINLLEPTRTAQLSPMARDSDSKKISNTKSGAWQYVCKRCHKPGREIPSFQSPTIGKVATNHHQAITSLNVQPTSTQAMIPSQDTATSVPYAVQLRSIMVHFARRTLRPGL